MRKAASAILLLMCSCAVGAPPGFSDGDTWGFPLVGPLENGVLVVPVKVNGKGPHLFAIDPDADMTSIDYALASELGLYMVQGPQRPDESDTLRHTVIAETETIQIADLSISNMRVRVHAVDKLWAGGRRLRGLIGRDVVSEGMTLAIDRDRGMVYLATQQGGVSAPPGAVEVKGRRFQGRLLVDAKVNHAKGVSVSVDLGAPATMLWPAIIASAQLPTRAVKATLVDELASERQVTSGALAAKVELGGAEADAVLVLPFADQRFRETDFDGSLGQTFLSDFHVTVNFHRSSVALKPRLADPFELSKERIRRWGARFEGCSAPACVTIKLGPPTEDGTIALEITREAPAVELDYEVVIDAIDAEGRPLGLPRLRATLPKGVPTVVDPGGGQYAPAAGFRILDVSPFPRPCDRVGEGARCVWTLAEMH